MEMSDFSSPDPLANLDPDLRREVETIQRWKWKANEMHWPPLLVEAIGIDADEQHRYGIILRSNAYVIFDYCHPVCDGGWVALSGAIEDNRGYELNISAIVAVYKSRRS